MLLDPKSLIHTEKNRRLIGLMCQLRLSVAPLLQGIMQRGLDYAAHSGAAPSLAGCYLLPAVSRSQNIRVADGLFARILEVQGDLEWTRENLDRNRRYGRIARALTILDVTMLCCLFGIIWWRVSR